MHDGDTELLRLIHLFEPLSRQEIERVAEGIPVKVFERGRNVYNPAYRGDIFFLLLRGRVRVYRVEGRHEVTFAIVRGGEVFGEAAFAPRRRMGDYAEALETSRVGLMRREALARIIRRYPQVGVKAVELFSERLCADQERIVSLSCKKVPSRLAALILDLARDEGVETPEGRNIPTSYTHEQLASMIGAKRVAVTRALAELQKSGAVTLRHRQIFIKDTEALERKSRE